MTFSFTGNGLLVAVFYRNKTLRTTVHYFIVNMAISDLIIPVVHLPWEISSTYHDGLWLVDGVLGTVLCKLVFNAWSVSTVVSILRHDSDCSQQVSRRSVSHEARFIISKQTPAATSCNMDRVGCTSSSLLLCSKGGSSWYWTVLYRPEGVSIARTQSCPERLGTNVFSDLCFCYRVNRLVYKYYNISTQKEKQSPLGKWNN